ncbi:MAG: hypothetical protein ACR2MX_16290 [Cyclobacteriaceae bacterium]
MKFSAFFKRKEARIVIDDLFMMVLLIANLVLILFDTIFSSLTVQKLFARYTPDFFQFYNQEIHQDFLRIDLWFVGIFVIELLIRWGLAIKNKTYHKWFFYPFIHWYDVLGCIPAGSFRFLRLLRIISIVTRLQRLKIIDLTKTYLYSRFNKYLGIFTEEVSDRVVINVLSGVQDEVKNDNPIIDRIISEVLEPQKDTMIQWLSHRVQSVAAHAHENYHQDIEQYVNDKIAQAVKSNKEIANLEKIPMVGSSIASSLEKAISDIVFQVIEGAMKDLASDSNKFIIEDLTNITLDAITAAEEDRNLDRITKEMMVRSLELIKEQVAVQQWKVREEQEKAQPLESNPDSTVI